MSIFTKKLVALMLVMALVVTVAFSLSACSKNKEEQGIQGPAGINGVDGKDGADGKDGVNGLTPYIGENGNWWIGEVDTGTPVTAQNGGGTNPVIPVFGYDAETGYLQISYDNQTWTDLVNIDAMIPEAKDGVSISSCEINELGELIVKYSDSTSQNLGKIVAESVKDGKDGVGITDAKIDELGNLTLMLSDGSKIELGNIKGADGANGENGVGVATADIDSDGNLTITLTDGTVLLLGNVRGKDGIDGEPGVNGEPSVTPLLRINSENKEWEVSYDNGENWEELGMTSTGAAGADGISPLIRINNGYWEVSHNNGTTWTSTNVKAVGVDGAPGANGRGIEKTEIIGGYLFITYTDGETVNVGKIGVSTESSETVTDIYTDALEFYPLGDGSSYGVSIGKAIYMEHIVIPESYNGKPVTKILAKAFAPNGETNTCLKSIAIPSSITEIETEAFANCPNLESVFVPESVETIAGYAFLGIKCVIFEVTNEEIATNGWNAAYLGCDEIKGKK